MDVSHRFDERMLQFDQFPKLIVLNIVHFSKKRHRLRFFKHNFMNYQDYGVKILQMCCMGLS